MHSHSYRKDAIFWMRHFQATSLACQIMAYFDLATPLTEGEQLQFTGLLFCARNISHG